MLMFQLVLSSMAWQKVSIVIPTFNEEGILPVLFKNLQALDPSPYEVIFVDGPSKDNSACLIKQSGYKLIRSIGKGRALQMNEGAYQSKGDVVVFLHADTTVPRDLVSIVSETLKDPGVTLAGFTSIMRGSKKTRHFISIQNKLKTYIGAFIYNPLRCICFGFRLLFGDQVMFCRKSDFLQVGGFNHELPIMEDADLCLRINKLGSIRQIKEKVYSSDRRVEALGMFRAYMRYLKIYFFWRLGAAPSWLKAQYEDIR
jgi:rSAM/selenodomain-associated transferase 2